MNCLLQAILSFHSLTMLPEVPPQVLSLLGHTVIVSPNVLQTIPKINHPHLVGNHGDIVEGEVTGAVVAGYGAVLAEQMAFLFSQKGWMDRAVIVWLMDRPKVSQFEYLRKRNIMNVICFTGTELYTYNPFNNSVLELEKDKIKNGMDSRWTDLQGYKVTIVVYQDNLSFSREFGATLGGGIDGSAISELVRYWNMTLDLKYIQDSVGRTSQSTKMLIRGQADISMNARFVFRLKNEKKVEFTTAIYEDSISVVMKEPRKLKTWDALTRLLEWKVWLALLIAFVIMNRALIWISMERNWTRAFNITLRVICYTRIQNLPKSTRERLVLGTGLFIALVTLIFFQASLIHSDHMIEKEKRMRYLSEVYTTYPTLITNSKMTMEYFDALEDDDKKLTPVLVESLDHDTFDKGPVASRGKEIYLLTQTKWLRNDLYAVEERLARFILAYVVKRGSPFLEKLSHFTSRAFECGLSQKWFRMTIERLSSFNKLRLSKTQTEGSTIHRKIDMDVAFLILIIELRTGSMNASGILQAFFSLQALQPSEDLPHRLLPALGHTTIVTPTVLQRLSQIELPYILAGYGDIVEREITGAIIAGDGGFLHEQVAFLNYQQGWMSRAFVVIIAEKPRRKIFRYLWKRRMMNAVCLTAGRMFGYNPFNDTVFRLDGKDVLKVFEERWKNLHGYRVPLAMFDHSLSFRMALGVSLGSGIDGSAIHELARFWNMTVDVKDTGNSEHRIHLANRMLYSEKAVAATNARFVSRGTNEEDELEYTTSIDGDSIVLVLKTPGKLKGWDVFVRIFGRNVWLSLLGTLILMNRAMLWFAKEKHWSYSISITRRALCNLQISKLPQSTCERLVLASGFYIGLVITTVFQASLFHFIKEDVRYEKMKTLSEVYNVTTVTCDTLIVNDFLQSNENGHNHVKRPVIVLPLHDKNLDKYALAIRYKEIKLLMRTGEVRNDLYIVDERINSFPLSYVVKRGSPFLEPLSDFTSKAFESGLSRVWYHMTVDRLSEGKIKEPTRDNRKVLSIKDIEVAFFALFFGYGCSLIMFLLELLTNYIHLRRFRGLRRAIRNFCKCMYPH